MSIPDEAMAEYYRLLLGAEAPGRARRTRPSASWRGGSSTASTGAGAGAAAEEHFNRVFVDHAAPDEIPSSTSSDYLGTGPARSTCRS